MVLMEALVHQRKSSVLTLVKQAQNFVWVSIIMVIIVYCLLMEKKFLSLKPIIKMLTQMLTKMLKYNGFGATNSREVSLKGSVYDLSFDYNIIEHVKHSQVVNG